MSCEKLPKSNIFLAGCRNTLSYDNFPEIQQKLFELKTYKATVEITVNSNKNTTRYLVNQFYMHPSEYRIEVSEPEFLKGFVITSNGKDIKVSNSRILGESSFVCQTLNSLSGNAYFLTSFFNNYVSSEKSQIEIVGEEYKLKTEISTENMYTSEAFLYIDREGTPKKMEINNSAGKARVLILFKEFIPNLKLDSNIF